MSKFVMVLVFLITVLIAPARIMARLLALAWECSGELAEDTVNKWREEAANKDE